MRTGRLSWRTFIRGIAPRRADASRAAGRPVAATSPAVSFDVLVQTFRRAKGDAGAAEDLTRYETEFAANHGSIVRRTYSARTDAGVLITGDGRLYAIAPPDASDDEGDLFFQAQTAADDALRSTPDGDRDRCLSLLYEVLASAIRASDAGCGPITAGKITALRGELKAARQVGIDAARRRAQLWYTGGVVLGVGLVVLVGLAVDWVIPRMTADILTGSSSRQVPELFEACINAGGAGALLSVMMRMSSRTLRIETTAGRRLLFIVGGMRPVIGAVSGVAAFTLYQAKFLPVPIIQPAAGSTEQFFLVGALAFLAGFSERLAQDAFVRTGKQALSASGDQTQPIHQAHDQ